MLITKIYPALPPVVAPAIAVEYEALRVSINSAAWINVELARSALEILVRRCDATLPSNQSMIAERQHLQSGNVNCVISVSHSALGLFAWRFRQTHSPGCLRISPLYEL